jgi:hypothetical protein
VVIAWRGDGRYFATTSAPAAPGGAWRAHVWDREGCSLHAAGEGGARLTGPACWQPNGRHLYAAAEATPAEAAAAHEEVAGLFAAAAASRLAAAGADAGAAGGPKGAAAAAPAPASLQRVVLFERNGLRHGGFDLPPAGAGGGGGAAVRGLAWSPDSELLAVVLGPPAVAAGGEGEATATAAATGGGGGGDGGWWVQVRAALGPCLAARGVGPCGRGRRRPPAPATPLPRNGRPPAHLRSLGDANTPEPST